MTNSGTTGLKERLTRAFLPVLLILTCLSCSGSTEPEMTQDEQAARSGSEAMFSGDYNKAIEEYGRAIELNSQRADYYLNRGIAYNGQKLYDKAKQDFDKAIELDGTLGAAYHHRAAANAALGHAEQSANDAAEAKRLSPGG